MGVTTLVDALMAPAIDDPDAQRGAARTGNGAADELNAVGKPCVIDVVHN
jgi:hypothetical protein